MSDKYKGPFHCETLEDGTSSWFVDGKGEIVDEEYIVAALNARPVEQPYDSVEQSPRCRWIENEPFIYCETHGRYDCHKAAPIGVSRGEKPLTVNPFDGSPIRPPAPGEGEDFDDWFDKHGCALADGGVPFDRALRTAFTAGRALRRGVVTVDVQVFLRAALCLAEIMDKRSLLHAKRGNAKWNKDRPFTDADKAELAAISEPYNQAKGGLLSVYRDQRAAINAALGRGE